MTHSHRNCRPRRRRLFHLLLAVVTIALPGFSQQIQWVRNYNDGMRLARENNRPVLVDFWSEGCLPCKQMDGELYTDPKLIETSRRFVFIRVNVDNDQATASRFAVRSVPMRFFLDPWERVLLSVKGIIKASEFVELIKPIPENFEPISESFKALEENSDDVDALFKIGHFYRMAGFALQASEFFIRAEKAKREASDTLASDGVQQELSLPPIRPGGVVETVPGKSSLEVVVPELGLHTPATSIVDLSIGELLGKYPAELMGVEFDSDQNELDFLLGKVGKNGEMFLSNLPNTLSKERIRQERLRPDTANGLTFWLPREVAITIGYYDRVFRNFHRYGGYRRFTVESYEKREPISRSRETK